MLGLEPRLNRPVYNIVYRGLTCGIEPSICWEYGIVRTVLVKTKRANCSAFERSVYYHGSKEWNNLPVYIRNITSYEEFKLTQKRWLLSMLPAL